MINNTLHINKPIKTEQCDNALRIKCKRMDEEATINEWER